MKYIKMLSAILLILFTLIINKLFDIDLIKYSNYFIIIFLLSMIIISTAIIINSYKTYQISKKFDFLYFSISYGIILFITIFIMVNRFTFKIFNLYYFYFIKFAEILIYFFGIFILKERLKMNKYFYIVYWIPLIICFYFFMLLKYNIFIFTLILFYIIILFIYRRIENRVIKTYFNDILTLKLISEIIFFISEISKQFKLENINSFNEISYFIYAISKLFFILSLYKLFLYINHSFNKSIMRKLYEKDKKMKKFINNSQDGIVILSRYFIKRCNDSFLELVGIKDRRYLVGKNLFSIFEGLKKDDIKVIIDNYPKESIIKLKKYYGKVNKLKVIGYKYKGEYNDEYILILKKEEKNNEIFENLNNKSEDIIYLLDKDEGYKYINRTIFNKLGYLPEEFYDDRKLWEKILSESHKEIYKKAFEFNKNKSNFEVEYISKDGKSFNMIESITYLKNDDSEMYYGIIKDISEIKNREFNLMKEKKEYEKKDLEREMGISVVSHEIRTPITAVIGFVETILLNKKDLSEKLKNIIEKIYGNSIRLKELVNNVLDFNKLNAGKLEVYKEFVEINGIVNEVIINNEMLMEIKNINCKNIIQKDLFIFVDPNMFYQIITNLISNSIKYNKENGEILIDAEEMEGLTVLKIKDTGIGIKNQDKDKIFEEYGRVKGSKVKGTGIGIPITKKLVEINNGKIWFDSVYNKGTTFYISFLNKPIKKY